ncbi:MAG: hypothetical protein KAX38_07945 [Candidatus Krumholzibacteria bacterium]|nr:hypothetical protein [Candidatus Krumholzibacteria bacterium]
MILSMFAAVLVIAAAEPTPAQGIKGRELLGIRVGGVLTTGELNSKFGSGSEMEIHFIEGLGTWFGIDIALSSHNLGKSKDRSKNREFTGLDREIELQIYSITAAFLIHGPVRNRFSATMEAGMGLYTINAVIHAGIYEGNITDNQFGLYGGTGLLFRLSRSLYINAVAKYHYIFSGSDKWHTIYFYTGKDKTGIYQIALGIAIFTG